MNSQTVEITSAGIRKILNKYTPERAIAEYVWNGFDAKATVVNIDFEIDNAELDTIKNIRITDNGTGICYEELPIKFKKFYESQKRIANENNTEFTRGKNGYGRFTFYKFARFANWETRYSKDAQIMSYDIRIDSDTLKDYTTTEPLVSDDTTTGTCVVFNEISSDISSLFITKTLIPYLKAEFAWFLELKSEYQIYINGQELDYSSIIAEQESISPILSHNQKNNINFQCKYIRWNVKMNDEYSRFYFLNNDLELKFTKTTLLNKKGDNFWHSVIVIDDFFNEINCDNELDDNAIQPKLFDNSADRKLFKELITQLNEFLKKKRRPFLKEQAEVMVTKYKNEDVFPKFGTEDWDIVRREGLENFVKELYEVEPAVFMKLNKEQKRVFLELLNLVMDSGERDSLFKILDAVVELDSNDRKEFAKILEITRLKQVVSTIKLISDRLLTLENLKKIVFNHTLQANEVRDLQSFIEKHYWIFGEEYRMVCAEEVKFEEALRKYIYILRGVSEKKYIAHPNKYKEMDLFLTNHDFRDGRPHNIVVEIKNPTTIKQLKSEQLNQLEQYMDVILKQDCFNDANEFWTFILIGQDYDDIVGRRVINKLTGLVQNDSNYSLYVKKWSEITNEVERRLKYLLDKLKIERATLSKSQSLNEVMNEVSNNTAAMVS
ncbi:ATP-binding protein [Bacteroides thetaiotaomicron]|uniref:ATP-binding protein n=1 Tax=Bacteroides thetaiotaomicron TaxID=818 RepID=UPI001D0743D7|nr:ATP-binding protein [Bacteroides thetaiotaomicron]MCB7007243.1 ATP-binding protein [Bacteroides thetaiotaomicron]MCB7363237.1 ATP-binding protein [Bacteroides thetaiotaomicron]MCQ5018249.1 ATP-binding protein [Bacteroides thetaiotaomicron]MCQ5106327.1 ATP-binding protein [Bacteroides thetaiotaomicron]